MVWYIARIRDHFIRPPSKIPAHQQAGIQKYTQVRAIRPLPGGSIRSGGSHEAEKIVFRPLVHRVEK
jgi:hypothetical protein